MPLMIVKADITKMEVDAIVNASDTKLSGGGGVDAAIHRAAGRALTDECRTLGRCKTGEAKITGGYALPCKHVIHTAGPRYKDGNHGEKELLEACYRNSLILAKENGCESVAFPLISSGVYRYPKDQALRVAINTISEFLKENDMAVYIAIISKAGYKINLELENDIARYISVNYALPFKKRVTAAMPMMADMCVAADDLTTALNKIDESFSQMLLRKIDEKGMTDAECYKKANIDRKLFSKIRGDIHYRPSKNTAIAFAIALGLDIDETEDMLRKAGFALSHSNKADIIIEYFINKGNYNIHEINEALFAFDQSLLGA